MGGGVACMRQHHSHPQVPWGSQGGAAERVAGSRPDLQRSCGTCAAHAWRSTAQGHGCLAAWAVVKAHVTGVAGPSWRLLGAACPTLQSARRLRKGHVGYMR